MHKSNETTNGIVVAIVVLFILVAGGGLFFFIRQRQTAAALREQQARAMAEAMEKQRAVLRREAEGRGQEAKVLSEELDQITSGKDPHQRQWQTNRRTLETASSSKPTAQPTLTTQYQLAPSVYDWSLFSFEHPRDDTLTLEMFQQQVLDRLEHDMVTAAMWQTIQKLRVQGFGKLPEDDLVVAEFQNASNEQSWRATLKFRLLAPADSEP